MLPRGKLVAVLFSTIAVCTLAAQAACVAKTIEAFGLGHNQVMSWVVGIVVVMMSASFVALSIVNSSQAYDKWIKFGVALLVSVEFILNLGMTGLTLYVTMPPRLPEFFGVSNDVAIRVGAFTLSAFLPILVFISIVAAAEAVKAFLIEEEPGENPFALMAEAERIAKEAGRNAA